MLCWILLWQEQDEFPVLLPGSISLTFRRSGDPSEEIQFLQLLQGSLYGCPTDVPPELNQVVVSKSKVETLAPEEDLDQLLGTKDQQGW